MNTNSSQKPKTDDIKIKIAPTPNPHAWKFIINKDVKTEGKITFRSPLECLHVPLARALLDLDHVMQAHFFENVITLTHDGFITDEALKEIALKTIHEHLSSHDPNFKSSEEIRRDQLAPELQKIEEILDRTIRYALQADGGDLQILELHNNVLTIMYEGACGSCPSSQMGTLEAIRGILRDEYDPEIEVVTV